MANPDYDALLDVFRDYKEEFGPDGYKPEHFLDWVSRQVGLSTDLHSLIALYERRLTELRAMRGNRRVKKTRAAVRFRS